MRGEPTTAANTVDDRPATERADNLADTIESAFVRLDELAARLGRPPANQGPKSGVGTDAPRPRRPLLNSLDIMSATANNIHDTLSFIESRL